MGRLLSLAERTSVLEKNGHSGKAQPAASHRVGRWDVDAVNYFASDDYRLPTTVVVRWSIHVDPVGRRFEVAVMREGWTHSFTLRGGEKTSALEFLNEVLAASFGVPA